MTVLLAGLGNPGREYERTRHNAGFMIADRVAARLGAEFEAARRFDGSLARAGNILILKPETFMNLSGRSVAAVSRFFRIPPERILVIYDDVALPEGKLRLRPGGSAGGHNGMKSIVESLGTDRFPRLRFGVGEAGRKSMTGHVLGKLDDAALARLDKSLESAADAAMMVARRGLPAAMNEFNRDVPPAAPQAEEPAAPPVLTPPTPIPPTPDISR